MTPPSDSIRRGLLHVWMAKVGRPSRWAERRAHRPYRHAAPELARKLAEQVLVAHVEARQPLHEHTQEVVVQLVALADEVERLRGQRRTLRRRLTALHATAAHPLPMPPRSRLVDVLERAGRARRRARILQAMP